LAETPLGLFNKCTALLERLEAEEHVAWTRRIGIGSGMRTFTDTRTGRPLIDTWIEASQPEEARPPRVYPTADELRARGLKVFGPKPRH